MIKGFFFTLALAAAGLATYLFFYLGMHKPVDIQIEERPALYLLYAEHLGPYHQIGDQLRKIESWALLNKVDCERTFGEFLDDPQAIDQDRLRSHAGCVMKSPYSGPKTDYKIDERPVAKYVVAKFAGAPGIGPFKVYPKVKDYFTANRIKESGPVIEIYSVNGDIVNTEFLFPITQP